MVDRLAPVPHATLPNTRACNGAKRGWECRETCSLALGGREVVVKAEN